MSKFDKYGNKLEIDDIVVYNYYEYLHLGKIERFLKVKIYIKTVDNSVYDSAYKYPEDCVSLTAIQNKGLEKFCKQIKHSCNNIQKEPNKKINITI